jgi:uncharacterized membrane protein YcjF (UPF0283 family)
MNQPSSYLVIIVLIATLLAFTTAILSFVTKLMEIKHSKEKKKMTKNKATDAKVATPPTIRFVERQLGHFNLGAMFLFPIFAAISIWIYFFANFNSKEPVTNHDLAVAVLIICNLIYLLFTELKWIRRIFGIGPL